MLTSKRSTRLVGMAQALRWLRTGAAGAKTPAQGRPQSERKLRANAAPRARTRQA